MGVYLCGLLLAGFLGLAFGQTQTRTFSCVTPSICRDGGSIIDPRILSQNQGDGVVVIPLQGAPAANPPGAGAAPGTGAPGAGAPGAGAPGAGPPGAGAPNPGAGTPGGAPTGTGPPNVGIVTPQACPAGYISCMNVTCGTPTVPAGSQDGFATQNAFPWQAFLRNNNNIAVRSGYAGGGVLLDQYHVLTAAHKVTNLTSISVLMGVYSTAVLTNVQTSQVAQVWIHSGYNQTYLKNDVAILRLATPVNLGGNVMPICLSPAGRNYIGAPSTSCVVSGWGQTAFTINDAPTQTLKQVHVPIVQNAQCTASYNNIIGAANSAAYLDFPNEICAGGQAQLDACTQDGGSPLVCSDTPTTFSLAGLVLWGKDCGQAGRYGVYLSVPAYLSWIQCTIQCIQGTQVCNNCPSRRYI